MALESGSAKGKLVEGFTVENSVRSFSWLTDEPLDLGGKDLGPTPSELLLSSLISCKLITLKMYSDRKGWDLQNANIELSYGDRDIKTTINKSIQLEGNLTEEQQKRLIDISGRCPVVKMLSDSLEFKLM